MVEIFLVFIFFCLIQGLRHRTISKPIKFEYIYPEDNSKDKSIKIR